MKFAVPSIGSMIQVDLGSFPMIPLSSDIIRSVGDFFLIVLMIALSEGKLFIALILVMLAVIVLGMGMPTSAAYLIAAILLAPMLIKLGVVPLAAHMFIFYFAVISMITPPVALAAFAAAAISESDLWETGIVAFKIALPGFLIPYIFVYNTSLLLEGPLWEIVWRTLLTIVGISALAGAVIGFFLRKAKTWERIVLLIGALLLIVPEMITDFVGMAMVGGILMIQLRRPSEIARGKAISKGGWGNLKRIPFWFRLCRIKRKKKP